MSIVKRIRAVVQPRPVTSSLGSGSQPARRKLLGSKPLRSEAWAFTLLSCAALGACSGDEADGAPAFPPPFSNGNGSGVPGSSSGNGLGSGAGPGNNPSGDQNLGGVVNPGAPGGNNAAPGTNATGGVPPAAGSGGSAATSSGAGGSGSSGGSASTGGLGGAGMPGGEAPNQPPGNGGSGPGEPDPGGPDPGGSGGSGQVTPPPQNLPGGLFMLDDFEGGRDPAWAESHIGGTGLITVDTSRGANGSSSSLRVDGNGVFHTMLQLALPAAVRTANRFYVRAFLRVDQMPGTQHFVWIETGTAANDGHEMRFGSNIGLLQINQYGGPRGGDRDIRDRNLRLTPNVWHCVQLFFNGNPEQIQVSYDGAETALSTTNFTAQRAGSDGNTTALEDWMPPFEAVRFGWELGGATIWYDDIAIGSAPIACD